MYLEVFCERYIEEKLKNYLSVCAPNYQFHPKYKQGIWNGKISFYNITNHLLPIGMFPQFQDFCKFFNYSIEFDFNINDLRNTISDNAIKKFIQFIFSKCELDERDYQIDAFIAAIRKKRGIVKAATGAGKSFVIYMLIRFLLFMKREILLVVPTTSLVEQMYSDFYDYKWMNVKDYVCRLYGGKTYEPEKPVLISTWQSIYNKPAEFFDRFGGLLIDECVNGFSKIKTKNGLKVITDVEIGDEVISFNEQTGRSEYKEVEKVFKHPLKSNYLYTIQDETGKIWFPNGITGNHTVYTTRGKIRIDELVEGDEIKEI